MQHTKQILIVSKVQMIVFRMNSFIHSPSYANETVKILLRRSYVFNGPRVFILCDILRSSFRTTISLSLTKNYNLRDVALENCKP